MGTTPSGSRLRRAQLVGGLIPVIGIAGAIVLAVSVGSPNWTPHWLPSGRLGVLVALPAFIVVAIPLFVAGVAWDSRWRPVPESLRALLSAPSSSAPSETAAASGAAVGRVLAGLITASGACFGPVVVVTASDAGLAVRRSRWPAFGARNIPDLAVPWSDVESIHPVELTVPRPATALVVTTSHGSFAIWVPPLRAARAQRLLTRPAASP